LQAAGISAQLRDAERLRTDEGDHIMMMDVLLSIGLLDAAALALIGLAWLLIGWWIERRENRPQSVSVIMEHYRREWMREFTQRDNRIFDAQILASLRQGTSFFASTTLLAIGGVLALAGNTTPLEGVAAELTLDVEPTLLWQIKLLLVALFLTHSFLKFVWSHRIFGYCSVMMAAIPSDPADPRSLARSSRAAELNIRAATNFNRGLRSMYFALAALGWLIGPAVLIATTVIVTWVLWSREFASHTQEILTSGDAPDLKP
jgi:uncharacterized membrane protein